jgi:hypothetical protein
MRNLHALGSFLGISSLKDIIMSQQNQTTLGPQSNPFNMSFYQQGNSNPVSRQGSLKNLYAPLPGF